MLPVGNFAASRALFGDDYRLADMSIESLLSASDLKDIERVVAASPNDWSLVYDGIGFGAASLGETLRHCRKTSVDELTEDDKSLLRALLFSSLEVYFALRVISRRFEIARIFYYGDYAYWVPAQVFAARRGVAVTHVSHAYNRDIDCRFLSIRPGHAVAHMLKQLDRWDRYCNRNLPPNVVADIVDGALYRLEGQGGVSASSPNWKLDLGELTRELKLVPGKKILVAYTSSLDELLCTREFMRVLGFDYARERAPFSDQSAWLSALTAWVGRRSDLHLVIRLHPRIGHNHRQAGRASQYEKARSELASVPDNVTVIWPESSLSSYNIAEFADVALVALVKHRRRAGALRCPGDRCFSAHKPVSFRQFHQVRRNAGWLFSRNRARAKSDRFHLSISLRRSAGRILFIGRR